MKAFKLIDHLFGKSRHCTFGRMHLLTRSGEPVTITKEIRYTVRTGDSVVHINNYDDLADYCKRVECSPEDVKRL